jgi:hypothetical protein
MREKIANLEAENKKYKEDMAYCYMCDKPRDKKKFYVNTDPYAKSGLAPICKDCARKIAMRTDENGQEHEPTKDSVQLALRYLNKPFINLVWESSIQESENLIAGGVNSNVWASYIKNISMVNYIGMTYFDSDMFKEQIIYEDEKTPEDLVRGREHQDTYTDYLKNKADVTRLISYDPFEKETISDQPFLYSQLLGLLDVGEEANEDMMRTASAISIVRGFLQQSKIDDTIAKLMSDIQNIEKNSAIIKSLQESKGKLSSVITKLAEDSCISLKYNKNTKKGENTWSGKVKKIKDLNLREGQVNGFDIATCKGMQQVQELSDASIMKQLALDDSEWSDMVAEMRVQNQSLRKERDSYKEINRILLRENLDLKDYFEENDIMPDYEYKDLKDMYSVFSGKEDADESDNPPVQ